MRKRICKGVGIRTGQNPNGQRVIRTSTAAGAAAVVLAARAVCGGQTFIVSATSGTGPGSLATAISQADSYGSGATIDFQNNLGTIDAGILPDITAGVTINGGVGNTVSGQNANRIFFVNAPGQSVVIESLTLANGLAHGGNGGNGAGGGGGGAGMGGAIFVNAGALSLQSIAFVGNAAAGGAGGTAVYSGGGGGGGLDYPGGSGTATVTFNGNSYLEGSGGGGGAHISAGGASTGFSPGVGGGANGGGAGANAIGPDGGGGGGILDTSANNLYFIPKSGGNGGDFGGGGGGPGTINNSAGSGGNGGFGAGGGGGGDADTNGYAGDGGNGGFGGGGGGGGGSSNEIDLGPSAGGTSAFNGGDGGPGNEGAGGGGAALGAAIFVRSTNGASLALSNCSTDAGSLTAGAGGYSELGNNGSSGAVSGGAMFLMGGTTAFTVSAGNAETIFGTIAQSQASAISMNGGGILVLSANNGTASGYSGGTTINGGELSVAADNALGTSASGLTFNGGLLQITGINDQSTARTVSLQSGGGGFDIASAANVFSVTQSITGMGGLTKAGAGTLVLPTAEGYTGVTTITNGTLEAGFSYSGAAATFPATDAIVVDTGGTLMLGSATGQTNVLGSGANAPNVSIPSINLAGGALTNYADTTHNVGPIDLAGGQISGSATTFSIFYDFTFNSPITVNATTQSSSITAAGGVGLRIQIPFNVSSGSGVLSVSAALHDEPNQSGGVTKDGPGIMELTGVDTYSDGTIVNAGTLVFGAPGTLPVDSALTINGGTAKFNNLASGATFLSQISTLSIAGAANAWTGKLDLTNTDMIIENGSLATLTNQVGEGFAGGTWNGPGGITSSAAASSHLTAIGVIQNNQSGTALFIGSNTFDGVVPAAGALLLKYTYYGDANLDGKVDASDYSRIDNGFLNNLTGWFNGDFNYDGVINGSDYTLIDNAFNTQGAQISDAIASPLAIPTAQVAGTTPVPEPAVIGLPALAITGLLRRRRRESR